MSTPKFEMRAAAGRRVLDPDTRLPIPEVGATEGDPPIVAMDSYWARRVRDGDVVASEAKPEKKKD